jgi:hypothetical protein
LVIRLMRFSKCLFLCSIGRFWSERRTMLCWTWRWTRSGDCLLALGLDDSFCGVPDRSLSPFVACLALLVCYRVPSRVVRLLSMDFHYLSYPCTSFCNRWMFAYGFIYKAGPEAFYLKIQVVPGNMYKI